VMERHREEAHRASQDARLSTLYGPTWRSRGRRAPGDSWIATPLRGSR
jgi:hypothetical protein